MASVLFWIKQTYFENFKVNNLELSHCNTATKLLMLCELPYYLTLHELLLAQCGIKNLVQKYENSSYVYYKIMALLVPDDTRYKMLAYFLQTLEVLSNTCNSYLRDGGHDNPYRLIDFLDP